MEVQARVVGPDDREETLTLSQVAPRRYRATFPLWGTGRYQVLAAGVGAGRSDKAIASLPVAYSPEYLQLHSNAKALKDIAERTGGRVLTGRETDLFDFERVTKESSRSVIDWFLILLACLVPLNVGLRRVQLDFSVVKGWFSSKKAEESSEKTMSALLKRKLQAVVPETPCEPIRKAVVKPNAKKAEPTQAPEPTDESNLSTTERLLARKRRREEERSDD